MKEAMPVLVQGDARCLPLPDESVDLICTSPPYLGLRDYGTPGQIGAEASPGEFIASLIEATREMVRVLKPSGSVFVNLGDKYSSGSGPKTGSRTFTDGHTAGGRWPTVPRGRRAADTPPKSLLMLPERYRIACVDDLGLIARAVLVWSKPNGLPESITDRVRRSHEDWVHLTKSPRYFSAVDEIREPYDRFRPGGIANGTAKIAAARQSVNVDYGGQRPEQNPLGKLPGSVWTVATQPLNVPAELNTDHFAAFPMEWPRRIISGWCPREVCTACGEGRRPVTERTGIARRPSAHKSYDGPAHDPAHGRSGQLDTTPVCTITGYACACSDTSAPASPGVVLDPFSGTGTTALVATMLGRRGIGVDLSEDYQRIARWRCSDPKERARAAGLDAAAVAQVAPSIPNQPSLFDEEEAS